MSRVFEKIMADKATEKAKRRHRKKDGGV